MTPRWSRPAEFLVYLVPVGGIPSDLFASYARLLQTRCELPLRSLTRPGGYAPELSPFRLDWSGPGTLRFRFVSAAERVDACDGEDVQACRRVVGVLGVCHSPSLGAGGLAAAHAQFEASVRRFPGLLLHKCFAFEHSFDDATAQECEGLDDLVMFPVHHEIQGTGESTVSLHLQVVMDTLAVNLLMALESVIRSATSSAAVHANTPKAATGDLASTLLDVNVEPHAAQQAASSPLVLSRDAKSDPFSESAASPTGRSSLSSGPSFSSIPSPLAGVGAISALDPRNRRRKRQLARREKLLGDYCVLVSCVSDAVDHYTVALEMLREEERRNGGAPGDALWLAAALEGYAYCLYTESQDKFSTELVERASEAIGFYAKAGTTELESSLIESMGWYYASLAVAILKRSSVPGEAKVLESVWIKRLLWEALERGLMVSPELQTQRQVEFLIQASRMLEIVGHRRRAALFLHDAASLLLGRNAPSMDEQMRLVLSPKRLGQGPQRQRDLEAALMLEQIAAARLGIREIHGDLTRRDTLPWEVTSLYRRSKKKKVAGQSMLPAVPDNSWLIIRFHVLRQLLTIARMLGDALLVGTYCVQLLEMLVWCDSIATAPRVVFPTSPLSPGRTRLHHPTLLVDHLQQPSASLRASHSLADSATTGLHAKGGVYFSPPPGIDTRVKRNFINSPSATMSNAAASLSSTLTNTPRILATPRQQLSAAVNAISTKASPAFTPFAHHHHNGTPLSRLSGEERAAVSRTPNVVEGKELSSNGTNGEAVGSRTERGIRGTDGEVDGRSRGDPFAESSSVWNLRSKSEIARIQQKLLGLLESSCTMLRYSEQVQLPAFLHVNKLKLRSSCNLQHPFLSRDTALGMFGTQNASNHQAAKSDFFYSPFEKQKKMKRAGQPVDEDDNDNAPAMYERAFPVHERIDLQVIVSNPTGVNVKRLQVKAWVVFADKTVDGNEEENDVPLSTDDGVECYPSFLSLEPYEKGKAVTLGIQPARVGVFHVKGCYMKAFNVTTSFTLDNPLTVRVVNELPMVSLSVGESGSMGSVDGDDTAAKSQLPVNATMRTAMFISETNQCTLRVRNTGNRPITNYRLAVNIQQRATKKTCVLFNNLPSLSDTLAGAPVSGSSTSDEQVETQAVVLRCNRVMSSFKVFPTGGVITVPFEIFLRGGDGSAEEDIQVEWSFLYADETGLDARNGESTTSPIFYRENKFMLSLVALPSLVLRSVSLFPCGVELPPRAKRGDVSAKLVTMDQEFCIVLVNVVNPTETTFILRVRYRTEPSSESSTSRNACEVEISRQCSRRLMVEVPRLQCLQQGQRPDKLIGALNSLLEMEWRTRFGTHGRLACEACHIVSSSDQEQEWAELMLPPVSFTLATPLLREKGTQGAGKAQNGVKPVDASERCQLPQFRHIPHMRAAYQCLRAELFQYVPVVVTVHRRLEYSDGQGISSVEIEIMIAEEGEDEMSSQVMVVGVLKTLVQWGDLEDETSKHHEIQCMFLSEGKFRVSVCGRVSVQDMECAGAEVRCHQPLHVEVCRERGW